MRKILFTVFSFISIGLFAQQTITHHEIENDVMPSGKLELFYANTGFPINEFFAGEEYTLLFSRYKQAFYLLKNQNGLIVDQLHLKDIDGIEGGRTGYHSQGVHRKYTSQYTNYLSGYRGFIASSMIRKNDTLFYCGLVRKKRHFYSRFYVSWSGGGKLQYEIIDNIPGENDFVKPNVNYEITFNKYFSSFVMIGDYYYPQSNYLLMSKSPWEKVENKFHSTTIRDGLYLYKRNENGKFFPARELAKNAGTVYNLFFDDKKVLFYSSTLQKDFLVLSGDSIIQRIPHPGINYGNWLVKDVARQKIYLFANVIYKNKNSCYKMYDEFSREEKYIKTEKIYDIYELDRATWQFKSVHHIKITGQIAQYLNEKVNAFHNDPTFRMHDNQVYLNIPIFSPDEQLGVFKVHLNWENDTTIIPTYNKQEYAFMEENETSFRGIEESIALATDDKFSEMPGKYAKVVTGKRFHRNRTESIGGLLIEIDSAIVNNPLELAAKFVAYDNKALGGMSAHHTNNYLYDAFHNMVPKWKKPLQNLLKAISVAGENVIVEQKGKVRHYTTPDGWHCSFVEIKNNWYLYYQFHKFDQMQIGAQDLELPVIEKVRVD